VTYFRMRMHTIIGATSFHDPVRDGKGWVQSAMTAKRNFKWSAIGFYRIPHLEEVNWEIASWQTLDLAFQRVTVELHRFISAINAHLRL
jgi:hypothetical protein